MCVIFLSSRAAFPGMKLDYRSARRKNAPSWWQTRKETRRRRGSISSARSTQPPAWPAAGSASDNAHVAATDSEQPRDRHSGPFDRLAGPLPPPKPTNPPCAAAATRERRTSKGSLVRHIQSAPDGIVNSRPSEKDPQDKFQ